MFHLRVIIENNMTLTTVHLLGFQIPHNLMFFVFFLLLIIYCVTICGNLLIITLVVYSKSLHSPMYFFLSQLSISDIILSSDVLPNTLHAVLREETTMSFSGCITQFYFFSVSGASECLLLTVMSYDRYLAICKPLHYILAMNFQICWAFITTCWISSSLIMSAHMLTISQLRFCGPNVMDHFFCDLDPILHLSCSDTSIVQLVMTFMSFFFGIIPFLIIIVSYVYIIITILKILSITGRQKAFSTCSSHLTVVCMYYGTMLCVYLIPSRERSWNITKFLSLLYTVVTPLMNPIIYSLKNEQLTRAVDKTFTLCLHSLLSKQ